jgi:hypothetical protein
VKREIHEGKASSGFSRRSPLARVLMMVFEKYFFTLRPLRLSAIAPALLYLLHPCSRAVRFLLASFSAFSAPLR